jgi:ABC-type branched-subunit amino acid transport system substrate-binding protein
MVGAIAGLLAGCSADQHRIGGAPRDLMPDISVQGDRPIESEKARLSVLLPLTGPSADIGTQLWDAAMLALFDGGRDDVMLTPHDTQGTPAGATAAAEAAVKSGAHAVIGPLFSTSVNAAKPVLAAHGIRGIALSNNRSVAGMPFFLIGADPETQIDALASQLAASGRNRILLFGPDTAYLQLLRQRLVLLNKAGKVRLVESQLYRSDASYTDIAKEVRAITLYDRRAAALKQFTAIFAKSWQDHEDPEEALVTALERMSERVDAVRLQLATVGPAISSDRKNWVVSEAEYGEALSELLQIYHRQLQIKKNPQDAMLEAVAEFDRRETLGNVDFDTVLLPIGGKPLLVIAPMFAYFNASSPNVWLVGTDVWESTARQPQKDLRGGRYVTTTSHRWKDFRSRFEATFGYAPDPLASTAYDALRVAIAEKQEVGHISLADSFVIRPAGFEGINGPFKFLPGGANERTLEIVELRDDGTTSISTWSPDQHPDALNAPISVEPGKAGPADPTPSLPPLSSLEVQRKNES